MSEVFPCFIVSFSAKMLVSNLRRIRRSSEETQCQSGWFPQKLESKMIGIFSCVFSNISKLGKFSF